MVTTVKKAPSGAKGRRLARLSSDQPRCINSRIRKIIQKEKVVRDTLHALMLFLGDANSSRPMPSSAIEIKSAANTLRSHHLISMFRLKMRIILG